MTTSSMNEPELQTLLKPSELKCDCEHYKASPEPAQRSKTLRALARFAAACVCIIVLVDLAIFASVVKKLHNLSPRPMEFRSPYVGLKDLYTEMGMKPSKYETIINEPRLSAQINSAEPSRTAAFADHHALTRVGTLTGKDRHFKVSSTIHTVAQFHVLDFGMETCKLAFRLPNRFQTLPHPHTLPLNDTLRLEVCELDVQRPLSQGALSWKTRPKCTRKLEDMVAKVGELVESEAFHCESGSFIGYQISCPTSKTSSCDMDIWSYQNGTWGFFINQYQSLF